MTSREYLRIGLDLVAVATTAANFWLFHRVPILKKTIKLLRRANDNLREAHDGLTEQHRLITEEAVRLHHLLNGRR